MKTVKRLQQAIDLVAGNSAIAVIRDSSYNQMRPIYHVLETSEEQGKLVVLFGINRKNWQERPDARKAIKELQEATGEMCLSDHLVWLCKDGQWLIDTQVFLDDEFDLRQQDEDDEWFALQREHFGRMETRMG